jgi:23S rRNA pseudouridine1911/1915/1917 synthase
MEDTIFQYTCTEGEEGRLDKFLVTHLPEFTRSRLQGLIADGRVTVDGKTASKSGLALECGMLVELHLPPVQASNLVPEDIPLEIIFENEDLVVINKAAGMVVHPGAGHQEGTLVHAVLAHAPELEGISGEQRPGVVHRLDKDTSGLILLAKNDPAHHWLQEQFRLREVTKIYLALVDGKPPTPIGRIEAAIGRDTAHRQRMSVLPDDKGRQAVSEYLTIEQFSNHTLLEVHPFTGRTHQIRVHLAFIGCPIVGDEVYGYRKPSIALGRHFLHAARLTIRLPGEEQPRTFEAPMPTELIRALQALRKKS